MEEIRTQETQNVTISTQDTNNSSAAVPDHRSTTVSAPDNTRTVSAVLTQNQNNLHVLINLVNTMSSLVKQVLNKDEKDDVSRHTLDQFSVDRNPGNNSVINSTASEYFGIHPEHIRNIDFVSETVKRQNLKRKVCQSGNTVNP